MEKKITLDDFKGKAEELIGGTFLCEAFQRDTIYADPEGNLPKEEIQRLKGIIRISAEHSTEGEKGRFLNLGRYLNGINRKSLAVH